uniref:NADH-ubiquinone oxidoreductase chain 2 n=1 Tax=Vincenzellus ruficollis TaxID=295991 RepID=A0A343A414_9CUCU|nr:NADH dehydrogenase subunit 2 [Vincenzellus ruficollis]AOY39292.1 NADH dehydrogenase subunit 2 [Vincenzellus ruficollis]
MFLNLMILGTLISISSYTWMGMWMGLEINLLSIIPLMNSTNNMFSSESALKYFITQTLASLIILFSIILMLMMTEFISPWMNSSLLLILNSALLTKLGAAPFHFWFPEVMEGLNWMNCFIILTWQKIAPMILIMNNNLNLNFLLFIIISSLLISTLMGFNQTSLRKILTFSSINHISWMLSSMWISFSIWLIYLLIYFIINFNIILMFYYTNSFYLNQLSNNLNSNNLIKISFLLNFLSLGGLPPFIGFLPKWLTINWLIFNNYLILTLMLILFTLIMLFVYIRIILTSLILNFSQSKIPLTKIKKFTLLFMNFFSMFSLISFMFFFNFL